MGEVSLEPMSQTGHILNMDCAKTNELVFGSCNRNRSYAWNLQSGSCDKKAGTTNDELVVLRKLNFFVDDS